MNINSIAVDQLIYTRVEEEYSREGQAGFQTFYHSGLPQPMVSTVEQRVRRFDVSHKNARRFQFFTLGNKVVLSHSVPIESHPQIIDKNHRPGAFLAHCLIYNLRDFRLCFQNDPFILLDNYPFLIDAVDMVEQFENPGSTMRQKRMAPSEMLNASLGKPAFAAIPLALHLLTSDAQCPLFIRLKPQSVLNFLKFLFRLLPADRRLEFSFDTCVDRYPIKPEWYKIICASADALDYGFKYIDARHIRNKKYNPHEMSSLSASWLSCVHDSGRLKDRNLVKFFQALEAVQTIENDIRTTGRCNLDILSKQTLDEIRDIRYELIEKILDENLSSLFNPKLSHLLIPYIWVLNSPQKLFVISITSSVEGIALPRALIKCVDIHYGELSSDDWQVIKRFAQAKGDAYLLFLSSTYDKRVDKDNRDKALKAMDRKQFGQLLEKRFCNPIPPINFLEKNHISILLRNDRIELMTDNEVLELITQLVRIDAKQHITKFISRIERFDLKLIKHLEKILRKQKDIPSIVNQTINDTKSRLQAQIPDHRFWFLIV